MSVKAINAVWEHSDAEGAELLTLLAIADEAHADGVTWCLQESVARKARLGVRSVQRAIAALETRGELEIRKAQRGRRRVNVCRVTLGELRGVEVDYDRLPFAVTEMFTSPSEWADREALTTRHPGRPSLLTTRQTACQIGGSLSKGPRKDPLYVPAERRSHSEKDAGTEASTGRVDMSVVPSLSVVPPATEPPIQTRAIGAYQDAGGDFAVGKGDRKSILAGSARRLGREGYSDDEILGAAKELGRVSAFPSVTELREAADRFREVGPPCVWGASGLDALTIPQLRECGCRLCEQYIAFKLEHGEAA